MRTDPDFISKDYPHYQVFLTDQELAERWAMSAKTLRNLRVAGGHVQFVRIGRLVRYRLLDVIAFEQANTCASTSGGRR